MPCDYSLEMYLTEDAKQGETYTLTRFGSGSLGFTKPTAPDAPATSPECAVCMKDGTLVSLDHPDGKCEVGVFAKLDATAHYVHRDGIRFSDGRSVALQNLPAGLKASVLVVADPKAPEDASLVSPAAPEAPSAPILSEIFA